MFLYIYLNITQTINDYENKSNKVRKCLWGSKSQNNLLHKTYIFNIISVIAPPNCWPENNWEKKDSNNSLPNWCVEFMDLVFLLCAFLSNFFLLWMHILLIKRMKWKLCGKKKGMRQREGKQASLRPGLNPFSSRILLKDCCIWPCETAC